MLSVRRYEFLIMNGMIVLGAGLCFNIVLPMRFSEYLRSCLYKISDHICKKCIQQVYFGTCKINVVYIQGFIP